MSSPGVYHSLLRPPVIQILRAVGFHAAPLAVVDSLTDLAARYLTTLAESVAESAVNSHEDLPVPTLDDILMALGDVGALRPQRGVTEEITRGEEDTRGLHAFLGWFSGTVNAEIRRVSGFIASEGELGDVDSLEKEDYLTALKKRHSKTGEESRYRGTILGKDIETHPVVIEGGAESLTQWKIQLLEARAAGTPSKESKR